MGTSVGEIIKRDEKKKIVCIGSTDLTHYGPRYGFTPMGTGLEGLRWADRVNDQRFIDLALKLDAEEMLAMPPRTVMPAARVRQPPRSQPRKNSAKRKGLLLAHTNSNEIMLRKMGETSYDSVGYAAIVF